MAWRSGGPPNVARPRAAPLRRAATQRLVAWRGSAAQQFTGTSWPITHTHISPNPSPPLPTLALSPLPYPSHIFNPHRCQSCRATWRLESESSALSSLFFSRRGVPQAGHAWCDFVGAEYRSPGIDPRDGGSPLPATRTTSEIDLGRRITNRCYTPRLLVYRAAPEFCHRQSKALTNIPLHLVASVSSLALPTLRNKNADYVAPTPQNTPLSNAPLTREALSRPTVGTIGEENEDAAGEWQALVDRQRIVCAAARIVC